MDPLHKLVADRLRGKGVGPHPEAEVLSAFAENALPANEREAIVQHLSTCADCRDILFLAAPPASEQQQVFSAPKARSYYAFRWGTLAACILIGAVILVSRRQGMQRMDMEGYSSAKQETSTPVANKIVAQDRLGAELDALRDKQLVRKPPTSAPTPARGHAEPKPSIAEPKARMAFDDSGQVSVASGAHLNEKLESPGLKDLPTEGRNVNELGKLAPGAAGSTTLAGVAGNRPDAKVVPKAPAPSASANDSFGKVGNTRVSNDYGGPSLVATKAPGTKDKLFSYGYVGGTISDSSGAAVPNAKVTAVGPLGEKTAVSDGGGKFSFEQLAAGTYLLKVDAAGFRKALSQVAVASNKPATADFKLLVGAATETVELEAAAPFVQPSAESGVVDLKAETATSVQRSSAAQITEETTKKQKADNSGRITALSRIAVPQQWSLSPQGTVQRSSDGGKTWVPIAVAEGSVFRAVAFIDHQVWAAGNAGVLYHSLDSGLHWTHVVPLSNGEKLQTDIDKIQFPDPQHVAVSTTTGQIWASDDGGQTWARQ